MPKTTEPAFNVELANVLRSKHPLWRDRVRAEQTDVFRQRALQPDVLVDHPGGLPVAVEVEFEPAPEVEQDARDRIGMVVGVSGTPVEQALAVRAPRSLSADQADLPDRIDEAQFSYCAFFDTKDGLRRWPRRGWIHGGVSDLAACIERVAVSERLLARGMKILERVVAQSAAHFLVQEELGFDGPAIEVSELLHQERGEQTARMAMAILANAAIFHNVIAGSYRIKPIHEIKSELGDISLWDVLDTWHKILREINYWPIFRIAMKILGVTRADACIRILNLLAAAAARLSEIGVTSLHDMSGRMFQRLIADRKFLATFYTRPTSAALLGELAVDRLPCDWSSPRAVRHLRIADLACGTGILLSAAYQAVLGRHRRSGRDDGRLHRSMMERSLIAADIMPAATHLAASMLSSAHPTQTFRRTRIFTMPYGEQEAGRPLALGSLDLILEESARPLFGTGRTAARGDRVGAQPLEGAEEVILEHESADLVIMNPPFTRPTNHESANVPVPSFAGFGKPEDEQRAMAKHLARIRREIGGAAGHGNAGLASNFFDLAHAKTKPGGVVALVLPASAISGRSWRNMRRLLSAHYRDVSIVSLAATGSTERAFSADTGMAEALMVATKRLEAEPPGGDTLFANLHSRPGSLAEAAETARAITDLPREQVLGKLRIGDQDIVGNFVRAPLKAGGCAGVREEGLAAVMLALPEGHLSLPRIDDIEIPTSRLGALGHRGLLDRDIVGAETGPSGLPRGPFDRLPIQPGEVATAAYPMLWSHRAQRERRLIVVPDSKGQTRDGCDGKAVDLWQRTASRLHFNRDFQINSQSLAACLTAEPSIGGTAWPNFLLDYAGWEEAFALCANTTLGLMSFWWVGTRQQQGRARITIDALPRLPVLDPRPLGEPGRAKAVEMFKRFSTRDFLPANEAYRDASREELDRAVLVELFGLPAGVLAPLAVVRNQWCAEPSVHGGKNTAISNVE